MWTGFELLLDLFLTLGGDQEIGETGFIGCMRNIEIGAERIDEIPEEANFGVVNGTCTIQDRLVYSFSIKKNCIYEYIKRICILLTF